MNKPLEYRTPTKSVSQFALVLGILSTSCAPLFFTFSSFHSSIDHDLWISVLQLIVFVGITLGLLGIVYSKGRSITPWIGFTLNLLLLAFFVFARSDGFGMQS